MTGENGNMYMPVVPQNYGGGDMFGGNSAWWIIILLIFGGWGNNGWGGYGNGVGNEVQRGFDQSAVMNGINGLQQQNFALQNSFQSCCCENRLGISDLKYTVATEACADRNAISMALRDVLEANNASTQKILDTMCQDKIDAKNETIALLRQQLAETRTISSIIANNEAQTTALEQYLAPTPRPAYIVQNPNCCQQNFGCGCGV